MKKLELIGKKLSRDELKKIKGGSLDFCICFGTQYGQITGTLQAQHGLIPFGRCLEGSARIACYPQQ